jgi:DNA-binding transcriptional ArsR family regulator
MEASDRAMDRRERVDWLVRLFLLPMWAESVLCVLEEEGPLTARALAERLDVDETTVAAELAPTAPLVEWGLVRAVRAGFTINPRIERFLVGT